MGIGGTLKSAAKAVEGSIVRDVENYLIPVKLQQLYKGYKLRDISMGETGMPTDFLITLAQLADHIYLTGTKAAHSREDSPFAISLRAQLGEMFQNYMQIDRFDAATGLAFETRGPFGAVVACAVPPGQEQVPVKGKVHPAQASYRLFIIFRGTVPAIGDLYTDDLSTDLKTAAPKLRCNIGNRAGEVARGFLNTYLSCRTQVVDRLVPRGLAFLNAKYREFAESAAKAGGAGSAGRATKHAHHRLPPGRVEYYIVGHSLGGAVATLCAYDYACRFPHIHPVLVTFGSPPVGNIDFAIDFNKVMVERDEYHPRTRYLRSVRVVARAADGKLDYVSALPAHLPNYIHVNTRVLVPSSADSRWGAHSIRNSYLTALSGASR
jgi:hypothetical protein